MSPHLILGLAMLAVTLGCLIRCYVKRDPQRVGWAVVAMLCMVLVVAAQSLK
jgi:hypothetical protein